MQMEVDFLIHFFSFSTGIGILLIYLYWFWMNPDKRILLAIVLLASAIANYLLGLYAYFLERDVATSFPVYLHFVIQTLTILGIFLPVHRLLFRMGARISSMELVATWISLTVMTALNMVARAQQSESLLYLSSVFFVIVGLLLMHQFWAFKPEKPLYIQIRRLALLGIGALLPAFILQTSLPDTLLKVHSVDAIAYLFITGCALWIALHSLSKHSQASGLPEHMAEPMSISSAQQRFELTEREYQVLQFLVQAKPYKTIAHELSISLHTVKSHASNIYRKTGAQGKSDLKHRFRLK